MKFSKEKFKQNADRNTKKSLSDHLDTLDGMEVVGGQVNYEIDGHEWYLSTVMPEWCVDSHL